MRSQWRAIIVVFADIWMSFIPISGSVYATPWSGRYINMLTVVTKRKKEGKNRFLELLFGVARPVLQHILQVTALISDLLLELDSLMCQSLFFSYVEKKTPDDLKMMVCKCVEAHHLKSPLFSDEQHGYIPGRSCFTKLKIVMDIWAETLGGLVLLTCILVMNYQKAFSSAWHCSISIGQDKRGVGVGRESLGARQEIRGIKHHELKTEDEMLQDLLWATVSILD